jgi:hypothetical protein
MDPPRALLEAERDAAKRPSLRSLTGRPFSFTRSDPVAPLDSAREEVEDVRAPRPEEKPMDVLAIRRRVEHTIHMCRAFDIEPDARTVAEIMADEDTASAKYEPLSAERALVFVEYERAAARTLRRTRFDLRSA